MIRDLDRALRPVGFWPRLARGLLLQRSRDFQGGTVAFVDAEGTHILGDPAASDRVTVWVRHPSFYRRVVRRGTLGAAESWMDGEWETSDLMLLIRLVIRNIPWAARWEWSGNRWGRWWEQIGHWMRGNSRRGAARNIRAHYDMGDEFFALFLDAGMNYSSALFLPPTQDSSERGAASDTALPPARLPSEPRDALTWAQRDKLDYVCRQLGLREGHRLLEIGCGWGALACHAARHYGCSVVATTISPAQYQAARARVAREGLESQVTILNRDYRDLTGKFDRIVSVEMIEAVGDEYYPLFFQCCHRLLKPDGLLLLQAITIVDAHYRQHLRSVDFICKYIFPGGSLPCISRLVESASAAAGLRLLQYQEFSQHYVQTLLNWRQRLHERLDQVRLQGFDERFVRMWDYYLAYCAAGFQERQINVGQLLFATRRGLWDVLTAPAGQVEEAGRLSSAG